MDPGMSYWSEYLNSSDCSSRKKNPSRACSFPRIWYILALGKVICFWIDIVPCLVHLCNEYCTACMENSLKAATKFHVFFICQIHSIALICLLSGPLNFNKSQKKCTPKSTDQLSPSLMFQKKSKLNWFFQTVPGKPYSCYWRLFIDGNCSPKPKSC